MLVVVVNSSPGVEEVCQQFRLDFLFFMNSFVFLVILGKLNCQAHFLLAFGPSRVCAPEEHKVPEPANLVRRKYLKISLLAENFDQNPPLENTETFLSHVYFVLTENSLYTLFT